MNAWEMQACVKLMTIIFKFRQIKNDIEPYSGFLIIMFRIVIVYTVVKEPLLSNFSASGYLHIENIALVSVVSLNPCIALL